MIFSLRNSLLFVAFMTLLIVLSYFYIDKSVSIYFMENRETFRAFGNEVSVLGESHWYFGIAILGALFFAFVKKNAPLMQRFLFLLYANLFSGLLSIVLKIFFARMRPWKFEENQEQFGFLFFQNPDFTFMQRLSYQLNTLLEQYANHASFPSGHTTTSAAIFTYLVILFPKYTALWVAVTLLSISGRVLANDHFVSDIFAGIIVGSLTTLYIYSKMKNKLTLNKEHS